MASGYRIELLLATRVVAVVALISKWCKAIEREAKYVQK